ncbi:DEAD/DEAH box helicase [Gulosibacter sp. 10]|uniref:DEAD/DEAH box helicase n=1 Tax=Gulosibacter sp. 10 TaxID=1255570 RepID=UPI00097F1FFF|nr:DEAD/DEAH box helicase [Gulosibacter sp. 10]SJM64298.1 ATP-dependent RNA helicase [Gulosibacter sp. 10]
MAKRGYRPPRDYDPRKAAQKKGARKRRLPAQDAGESAGARDGAGRDGGASRDGSGSGRPGRGADARGGRAHGAPARDGRDSGGRGAGAPGRGERSREDGARDERARDGRSRGERSREDRPGGERSHDGYARHERPAGSRPAHGASGGSAGASASRARTGGQKRDKARAQRERDRAIDEFLAGDQAREPRREREHVVHDRLEARITSVADAEGVRFADLGLDPKLIRALAELGADEPFPIQVATIPDALGGRHVLGRGRTGSGKTIAFGSALVQRLYRLRGNRKQGVGRAPQALILAPTRELALQLDRTVQPLARALGLFTTQVYGGVAYGKQNTALRRGVDIVIGTPGRVEDLVRRGNLDLSQVVITVLDEADEMSDMGFIEPVERLLDETRPTGQRMLFSATLDAQVLGLVEKYLPSPAVHEVADDALGEIEHRVLIVDRRDREPVLAQLAGSGGRVLIFRRMRAGAEELAQALAGHGVRAVALHGDLDQKQRQANLAEFTHGGVNVLVATDVAARGIHVDDVRLVVQADPPADYKAYLHRAGRTGRAGNRGLVATLVQPGRERKMVAVLGDAEIDAPFIRASPGGPELDEFLAY